MNNTKKVKAKSELPMYPRVFRYRSKDGKVDFVDLIFEKSVRTYKLSKVYTEENTEDFEDLVRLTMSESKEIKDRKKVYEIVERS